MVSTRPVGESQACPTVAVIGGGPGAMFFCHALETQKHELLAKGEDVSGFPIVQCFERAPGPGGVWRSDRAHDGETGDHHSAPNAMAVDTSVFCEEKKEEEATILPPSPVQKRMKVGGEAEEPQSTGFSEKSSKPSGNTPNMYSALWTNGVKEHFEFADYNFVDHFGEVSMPTYLPRKYVLEYILGRCTNNCPNFFEKYFSFRTSVVNVQYLEGNEIDINNNKFRVQTRNETTGIEEIMFFDKCIWAGGLNGIPYTPKKIVKVFRKGGFQGPIVHSSDTTNFKQDVENKTILIVGGGLSAEDLALMAIKEGASQIHCTFRSERKEMNEMTRWPYDKVETYAETTIKKVKGNTVTLVGVYRDVRQQRYRIDSEIEDTILKDIDTVILCTGYSPNLNMLDSSLHEAYHFCSDCDGCKYCSFKMPEDWRMKKNKFMEVAVGKDFGHVKPTKRVWTQDNFYSVFSRLYRGSISIKNPNMMYFFLQFTDTPLMELDISAWMMARYVTRQSALPSRKEMEEEHDRINLESMDNPFIRYDSDYKFSAALDEVIDWESTEVGNAWYHEVEIEVQNMNYRLLGKMMNEYGYPVSHLCEDGETFSKYNDVCRNMYIHEDSRSSMDKIKYDTVDKGGDQKDNILRPGWQTFRDAAKHDVCKSYFTGTKSCPLPKPWFELNEDDKLW